MNTTEGYEMKDISDMDVFSQRRIMAQKHTDTVVALSIIFLLT